MMGKGNSKKNIRYRISLISKENYKMNLAPAILKLVSKIQ